MNQKMKKLIYSLSVLCLFVGASVYGQAPQCSNDNGLEGRIDAVEAQGWVEVHRDYQAINYLVPPEPPYVAGTLTVTFAPDCDPGEPCIQIVRFYQEDAVVLNDRGNCVWRRRR